MRKRPLWSILLSLAGLLLFAAASLEAAFAPAPKLIVSQGLEGPVRATVERVIDGDTIEVRADIWLGQSVLIRVRIDGIDTPELEARCPEERQRAVAARDFLVHRLAGGAAVKLSRVTYDKYGGRVRARVSDAQSDIADALLAADLARPYYGGRREPWC
jgi:endonuclease YncB( thermonuclease family)